MVAGLCALVMRPGRLIRSAIVLKPSALPAKISETLHSSEISVAGGEVSDR